MKTETGPQTIARVLSAYELGPKLRRLRLRRKLGLKELGLHTGLSPSMLSQLENGKMVPTLPTLARIAMVFDVGLEHFFEKRGRKTLAIVRAQERIRFPERAGHPAPAYFFENLAFAAPAKPFEAYFAEFPKRPADEDPGHLHEGGEFLYVTDGELVLRIGSEEVRLAAGDSVYFDSSEPHAYRGAGKQGARAIVVTMPPRL